MAGPCVACGYAEEMHGSTAPDVGMVSASVCANYVKPKFDLWRWLRGGR